MSKYLMLAFTNPVAGKDAEYNDWYDNVAMPVYRTLPGLKPLGRYRSAEIPKAFDFAMTSSWQYLSVYEFVTDGTPAAFLEKMKSIISNKEGYYFSEAIDKTSFFEPLFVSLDL
jgi:hypothetical protein